jgi:tRNA pseudouridine55 synthase
MDGLLVINKSSGPTSHDVVATARRVLREKRIGHTGTLDPLATGVLPLVLGRATRLARFLTAHDKEYVATIALGVFTDTGDSQGQPIGDPFRGAYPCVEAIELALDGFRGTFMQQPPAFSAKKVDGRRSYRTARARSREARTLSEGAARAQVEGLLPAPVSVTVRALELIDAEGDTVTVRLSCSAGFYVRTLAANLGERLGTGAHLAALIRTRSGDLAIDDALPYAVLCDPAEGADRARAAMVPLDAMLRSMPAIRLTPEGAVRAGRGQDIGPAHAATLVSDLPPAERVRLLGTDGSLMAIAEPSPVRGFWHPALVLTTEDR